MTNAEWFAVIESVLGDFKGVSDAASMMQIEEIPKLFRRVQEWESLDRQVKTLEANKGIKGSESDAFSQVEKWLAVIKDKQRQLRDAIKDLIIEVKHVVMALQLEMSELIVTVKVMMMAMDNSSQEGGASK